VGFFNISWWIWGCAALVIGLVYIFFVPKAKKIYAAKGLHFVILRWFHSLVWLLLAFSFFMRASENNLLLEWASPVAILGGVLYFVYLITFIKLK
jgi:hypothetical protein